MCFKEADRLNRLDFVSMIEAIKSEQLVMINSSSSIKIKSDSSIRAFGWYVEDEKLKPVSFGGRILNSAERKQIIFELELGAIALAMKKNADLIQIAAFTEVSTDNDAAYVRFINILLYRLFTVNFIFFEKGTINNLPMKIKFKGFKII